MREQKDNLVYIHHILDAIKQIEEYLKDIDFESFSSNRMVFDATNRELEIIGEASNNIDETFKKQHPDIP